MIQPHIYRAPEVTSETALGSPADIWNVACLIWDLFEGKHLFHDLMDEERHYDPFRHMAQIIGFLVPPPRNFSSRSETTSQCFDPDGKWKTEQHAKIPETSLEQAETRLQGRDKELFLQFIRSMLTWIPEERKTARELLDNDPWLNERLD
ncbi:hypothetical protein VTN00DRAFT_9092 [Thermoascus crustaceus]|uniref:uncharacterized protein n=1 Tax=Thermoascus crustaceus TaxID=5088 RepID=UPI003742BDE0